MVQLDVGFSRKRPKAISYAVGFHQSKTALFDFTRFRLNYMFVLIVSRVDFNFFELFLVERGGWCEGVLLLYSSRIRLAALCFALSPRATARRTFVPASWWLWAYLAESRQSYVREVALSPEPLKLQQAQPLLAAWIRDRALLPSCDTRCWRAKLGMRHADFLREATAGILQCGTWYRCVAVWPRGCVFGGGMSDAIA